MSQETVSQVFCLLQKAEERILAHLFATSFVLICFLPLFYLFHPFSVMFVLPSVDGRVPEERRSQGRFFDADPCIERPARVSIEEERHDVRSKSDSDMV